MKILLSLLSLWLTSAVAAPSSLSSSIDSVLKNPSSTSSLTSMRYIRTTTQTWDKEFQFAKLGLDIKLKYVDPNAPLKGTQVFVDFTVPEMLQILTFGVTKVELDLFLEAPKINEGIFNMKIGYKIVKNTIPVEGTVDFKRVLDAGKYVTKIVLNKEDILVIDFSLAADMKNKCQVLLSMGGKTYDLKVNRVRGSSLIISSNSGGEEYTAVIHPDFVTKKISINTSFNRISLHNWEIIWNPISSEMGLYIIGNVMGPLDCKIVLQRDLTFAQIIINHNKVNQLYFHADGKIQMPMLIPDFMRYSIKYDILQGQYGEGRAKINFNSLDVEKVLTIGVAPKTGHAYDFELKYHIDLDYSFAITHELTMDTKVLYTASHKHQVAFNSAEKWMSVQKDKCIIPKDTKNPLYVLLQNTYVGEVLSNMYRSMAINIDWRKESGMTIPKIEYTDRILADKAKHLTVSFNTMTSPASLQILYPRGPTMWGQNFGLRTLLGKDMIDWKITHVPMKEVKLITDVDDICLTIKLPNWAEKPVFAIEITHTKQNEKALELAIYNDGLKYNVNGFSSFFTPRIPYICTTEKQNCQWSGVLNYEVDFGQKVLEVVPVQYLALSVTRDFETLIEVQQSQKQTPAHLRINCPSLLPKMIDVSMELVPAEKLVITAQDYLPGEIVVKIAGTKHIITYENVELATIDLNLPAKNVLVSLPMIHQPIVNVKYTTEDIFNNQVTMAVVLPVLQNIVEFSLKWKVQTVSEWEVQVAPVVVLPVVGKTETSLFLKKELTFPQGKMEMKWSVECSQGLLEYVPPVKFSMTTLFNVAQKQFWANEVLTVKGKELSFTTDMTDYNINNELL